MNKQYRNIVETVAKGVLPLFFMFTLASCAHYQPVPFMAEDENGMPVSQRFAVAKNGEVIPEYTISLIGEHPVERAEAIARYKKRRSAGIDEFIDDRYFSQSSAAYQTKRIFFGTGLSIVGVVVVPIMWLGNVWFGNNYREGIGSYWYVCWNPPLSVDNVALVSDPYTVIPHEILSIE